MPGPGMLQGAKGPTPLEEVKVHIVKDFWETQKYCTANLPPHQVALNCLLNACVVMGCVNVQLDLTGKVERCFIFVSADWDYLIDRELKHCEGYDDTLY
jgi:hypothetical protein